mmetsp:Transcript_29850/g.85669  ORF Transcript_29850/g.85669 Transcript_29850/m.85669 type:complete len:208 (+) Transcript_29850:811-1434(+)
MPSLLERKAHRSAGSTAAASLAGGRASVQIARTATSRPGPARPSLAECRARTSIALLCAAAPRPLGLDLNLGAVQCGGAAALVGPGASGAAALVDGDAVGTGLGAPIASGMPDEGLIPEAALRGGTVTGTRAFGAQVGTEDALALALALVVNNVTFELALDFSSNGVRHPGLPNAKEGRGLGIFFGCGDTLRVSFRCKRRLRLRVRL